MVRQNQLEDQERDKAVYKYLLECLTDLGLDRATSRTNEKPRPNERSIATQWGQKDNRIFIRRVLRSVLPEYYQQDDKADDQTVPGLTLGKLVEILDGIQEYWAKKDPATLRGQVPEILTRSEKLRALYKFSQLSLDERERLKLPTRSGNVLMQQLIESITDPVKGLSNDDVVQFYRAVLNLYESFRNRDRATSNSVTKANVKAVILQDVTDLVSENFCGRPRQEQKEEVIRTLVSKVEQEISRVAFQCGLKQVESLLKDNLGADTPEVSARYLPQAFVKHLTHSVVENEILTDEFPVYLKYFTVEKIKPLPLYVKTETKKIGLLNNSLLNENEDAEDIKGLAGQHAYKVTVHFYIKLPENYRPKFPQYFSIEEDELLGHRFDFFEEVTGVGSLISLITAAINSVLLWDIPVLQQQGFLAIAHETLHVDEIIGQSGYSPVWSNLLTKLCKEEDIKTAINTNKSYDEVTKDYELSYGEFCGFDLIEVTAKASLHARLRAIKQAGIDANTYLTQLCHRVEELQAFRQAKKLLELYPFSLRAMEAHLDETIFSNKKYRSRDREFIFVEENASTSEKPVTAWSLIAYDAHLTIARSYLMEGLYRIGKKFLDALKLHVEHGYLTDTLLAKYELCRYRYYSLADLKDSEFFPGSERHQTVEAALNALDRAEEHLKNRLEKYYKLNEFSQSNFHPFFYLLSKINAHRAKLYIFSSSFTPSPGNRFAKLLRPIQLLEKARIYAAQDGNSNDYSYWSVYQSWCYIILAYLDDTQSIDSPFSFEKCMDWAKRLVDHALICYSSLGHKCYQAIKDNGGRVTAFRKEEGLNKKYYEQYGQVRIQGIPFIEELREIEDQAISPQGYDPRSRVLSLDMSILKQMRKTKPNSQEFVYLFGTHSALLLFATGMLELCEEQHDELVLIERVRKALRMFTYCWATAQSGVKSHAASNADTIDPNTIDRNFKEAEGDSIGDSIIQGLYPHRINQFADLGKVFAAVCKILLLLNQPQQRPQDWQGVDNLLDALHDGPHCHFETSSFQERYNGHLEIHFENIRRYVNQVKQMSTHSRSVIENRNKVVKEVFKCVLRQND